VHPLLALAAVFAGALAESLALIGSIVPGSVIVFAAGVLAGLRVLDPWVAGALEDLGAMLGDKTTYVLGRGLRGVFGYVWPMRRFPGLLARGEAYFAANGRKSIFVGRFLGPVRAIVPLVAGMARMPVGSFLAIDALAALAWAAAHLFPGVLFGASLQLAGAVSARLVVLVAIVAAVLWLIALVIHVVTRRGWPYVQRLRARIHDRASHASGPFAETILRLVDPQRSEALALLVAATLLVAGAWLLLGVVEDVVTRDTLVDVDHAVYGALSALRSRIGDDVMMTISELAGPVVTMVLIAAIGVYLALTRRFRTLAYWLAAALFAVVLVFALKHALARARPETAYAAFDEYSLPSGHAAMSLVVYGFLAFLLGHERPAARQGKLVAAAAGIAVLVGFSRIYLGVHWLSDVIASFGLGVAWIALLAIAYIQHVHERPLRSAPVLAIVVAVLVFVGAPYVAAHHARDMTRYAKVDTRPTLSLDAWRDGGWRDLPQARMEIRGVREEAFVVQWAAPRGEIAQVLTGAGWRMPAPWRSQASLLWLVPSTAAEALPVLPKLHQGQPPSLTLIRPRDPDSRDVVRFWHVADAGDDPSSRETVPIYAGTVTTERVKPEAWLVLVARTQARGPGSDALLEGGVRSVPHAVIEHRAGGANVLLVW
jgi:undecaprenyl-diphosphatase